MLNLWAIEYLKKKLINDLVWTFRNKYQLSQHTHIQAHTHAHTHTYTYATICSHSIGGQFTHTRRHSLVPTSATLCGHSIWGQFTCTPTSAALCSHSLWGLLKYTYTHTHTGIIYLARTALFVLTECWHVATFLLQYFLFKCMGIVMRKSTKKDLVSKLIDATFENVKHGNQLEREVRTLITPACLLFPLHSL